MTGRPLGDPAWWLFVALVLVAGPVIALANPGQWFRADEFTFLFKRELTDPATWFTPHWGHLTALPVIPFQALYRLTGLRDYWPYLWLAIATHLAVAVTLRQLMRRAGVGSWLATAAVAPFVFLGSGRDNLTWGFQVTLTGSLAFGLGALVVLVGPRGATRRGRAVAGGLLVGSVLCSNVGLVMVAVAAALVLLAAATARPSSVRGALDHLVVVVAPAGLVYLAWVALAPPSEWGHEPSGPREAVRFAVGSVGGAVERYSQTPVAAAVVAAAAVAGLGLLVRRIVAGRDPAQGSLAAVCLAGGAVAMALLLGFGRAADPQVDSRTSRYVYLVVAFALVPLAAGVQEVVRGRGRWATAAACALVLIGLPGNASTLGPADGRPEGSAAELVRMAELTVDSDIPDDEIVWGEITAGALRTADLDGLLPVPGPDPEATARAAVKVTVRLDEDPGERCVDVDPGAPVELRAGEHLVFRSDITLRHATGDGPLGRVTWQAVTDPTALLVRRGPVDMWLSSSSDTPIRLCR